ncbi:MAG: sporulation protein, partial [Methylococcaceae bacterium]|nr:sporulation protein [Methylococcaceae bacterium]
MARDYKHRANRPTYEKSRRRQKKASVSFWRLLVVAVLIVTFVVGLNKMSEMVKELLASSALTKPIKEEAPTKQALAIQPATEKPAPAPAQNNPEPAKVAEPEEPRYDFYTILPQAEVVVPDYEIKTRVREEMVGKAKTTKYIMQAGSFREMPDAEKHKAKLAQLGIQSKIESA